MKTTAALTAFLFTSISLLGSAHAQTPSTAQSAPKAQAAPAASVKPETKLVYRMERDHDMMLYGGLYAAANYLAPILVTSIVEGLSDDPNWKRLGLSAIPVAGAWFSLDPETPGSLWYALSFSISQVAGLGAVIYGAIKQKKAYTPEMLQEKGLAVVPLVGKLNGAAVAYRW